MESPAETSIPEPAPEPVPEPVPAPPATVEPPAKKAKPEIVFFFSPAGKRGWMSNRSRYAVRVDDKVFPTVEHYFMHCKAVTFGDGAAAANILLAKTPTAAKNLGRAVGNYDDAVWAGVRYGIMKQGLMLKVAQHASIKAALQDTGDAVLAEASPVDAIWGIGMSATTAKGVETWPGMNLLGKAWMEVREEEL